MAVINSVLIETPHGVRTFELIHGDVLADPADLLVISTHHNPQMRPTGRIVSTITQRYGIEVDVSRPWLNVTGGVQSCIQRPPETVPFGCILIMRIAGARKQEDPVDFYDKAVRGTFAAIGALEFMGDKFQSISLPVLSGQRIVDYQSAVKSLLSHSIEWLRRSTYAKRLGYYVFEDGEIAAWDQAMNDCLGRSYVDAGKESILRGLCHEIVHGIDKPAAVDAVMGRILSELREALVHPDRVSPQRVAAVGRKIAEHVTERVLDKMPGVTVQRELINNIEALRKAKVADWMLSYLHSLRVFGNEAVHDLGAKRDTVPSHLTADDLVSILSAIRSVMRFWEQWPQGAERIGRVEG